MLKLSSTACLLLFFQSAFASEDFEEKTWFFHRMFGLGQVSCVKRPWIKSEAVTVLTHHFKKGEGDSEGNTFAFDHKGLSGEGCPEEELREWGEDVRNRFAIFDGMILVNQKMFKPKLVTFGTGEKRCLQAIDETLSTNLTENTKIFSAHYGRRQVEMERCE